MSTLIAERRRALENDDGQESLFTADLSAAAPATESLVDVEAAPRDVPAHAELVAGEELVALERAAVLDDVRKPRAPLAGPTLDDVMSRVWEGLATGLPAACPVCRGEVVPTVHGAMHGRCSSCGTTID
jgi:hypothetical protein